MTRISLFILVCVWMACQPAETNPDTIVDRAIDAHGGDIFSNSEISFDFRDRHYIARRNKGLFSYERIFKDSADNQIHDFLTNAGFSRQINGSTVNIPDSMAAKYARSVNSTIYFASLPYGLNDPAVKKRFWGNVELEGKTYYQIEVTFQEEGGGEDHTDIFLFWFDTQTYQMDYLAYLYFTDGGGLRFRKAIRKHPVNGLVLQDYLNYEPVQNNSKLEDLAALYEKGYVKGTKPN